MLTNKISGQTKKGDVTQVFNLLYRRFAIGNLLLCLLATFCLTACGPPGPRALLKGERLIRDGKYDKAISKLQEATQLLPKSAQAWNYLGLAYHANGQPLLAVRAYKQALQLDSSLAVARFNLGCAFLEQNDLAPAIEQLTSFVYVQNTSSEAWLKLGTAHYRTNHFDSAEKSFRAALDLQPNNVEALNGMGLVQFQKRRYAEALNSFNLALLQNPRYGPALLNAAIVNQRTPSAKSTALDLYRRYLALNPPDADKIRPVASQLDAELNPPPPTPPAAEKPAIAASSFTAPVDKPGVKGHDLAATPTNISSVAKTQLMAKATVSNPPAISRTNQIAALSNPPPRFTNNAFALSNLPVVPQTVVQAPTNSPLEVTHVEGEIVVVPPQDISTDAAKSAEVARATVAPVSLTNTEPGVVVANPPKQQKDGFLSHLNPFSRKPKPEKPTQTAAVSQPATKVIILNSNAPAEPAGPIAEPPPIIVKRYEYQFPPKPSPGNRTEALKYLTEANRAYQAGIKGEAISKYKKAAAADPSFFEAYYNLALAAYGINDWTDALSACERALAIRPESVEARFWFALALREAKYPQDAADQLLIIVQNHPEDYRAHLSLANLYARQLNQSQLAREHYVKVLELAPHHAEASNIRSWLAGNPPKS